MKIIKSAFTATIFFLTTCPMFAQSGNVMTLKKIVHTTSTSYSSRSVYPSTTTVQTGFEFSINGGSYVSVGRHYKNLEPYFKNCDVAIRLLKTTRNRDKIEVISKVSGGVLFLVGGILAFTGESKTPGIVVASTGVGLAIFGMVEQGLARKSLRKSVAAYNDCELKKNKTGLLKQVIPMDIAIISFKMNDVKSGMGLRLSWPLSK